MDQNKTPLENPSVLVGGRYRLIEHIRGGGMGTVWRADDELLGRPVAVKILHGALDGDATIRERFRREAIAASTISHPSIASVFDYVDEDDRRAIVMELVEGETLAARIARGPLPPAEAARIFDQVLGALQALHDRGVLHRDVKPSNILLTPDGRVKVTDFGVASMAGEATLTMTGTFMATPQYAAPEQLKGEASTPATDIYQTGVALYEALSGKPPFQGETAVATAMVRLTQDPPPLPPDGAVAATAMRALERDPAARFASAQQMRDALSGTANPPTMLMSVADEDTVLLAAATPAAIPAATEGRRAPHRLRRVALRAALIALILGLMAVGLTTAFGGASTLSVPTFTNRSLAQAKAVARDTGLTVTTRTASRPGVSQGTVFAQSPLPGATVKSGTAVTLTVADGCCTVPRIPTAREAESLLEGARLRLGQVTTVQSSDVQPGTVISQTPPAGQSVAPGTAVRLVVAQAPPPPENRDGGKGKKRGKNDEGDD